MVKTNKKNNGLDIGAVPYHLVLDIPFNGKATIHYHYSTVVGVSDVGDKKQSFLAIEDTADKDGVTGKKDFTDLMKEIKKGNAESTNYILNYIKNNH